MAEVCKVTKAAFASLHDETFGGQGVNERS